MQLSQKELVINKAIDINCDLGEGFGCWRLGDSNDIDLMDYISSANIAAGFHAGDPNLIDYTIKLAVERGVGIGAHPGYRDLLGFGRRKINGSNKEIINDVIYQVGAIKEFARRHGVRLQHVKPHGALYMEIAQNESMARSFIEYMQSVSPNAFIYCMGFSRIYNIAKELSQPVICEFYADRDYSNSGSIVFTRNVAKLDPKEVADKVVRACIDGKVRTVEGDDMNIEFESVCFHSDTPGSLSIAQEISKSLRENNIQVVSVSEVQIN